MGAVQAGIGRGWTQGGSLQHVLHAVEGAGPTHYRHETHDGFVLGVPAELHSDAEGCQQASGGEVRGNSYITLLYSDMHVENQIVKDAEKHLLAATKAQSYLKAQVEMAKGDLKAEYLDKGLPIPPINSSFPACRAGHYSFDFAQQVPLKD